MWLSWSKKEAPIRVGAIVDVGDSKIEVALVASSSSENEPDILWTHVEALRLTDSDPAPIIKKAIFDAFRTLQKEGVKTLRQHKLPEHISLVQASLHAPHTYTAVRNVSVKAPKTFGVTRALVKELEQKANADALKLQSTEFMRSGLKLYPLSSFPISLRLNGYPASYSYKGEAKEVSLAQHVSLSNIDFNGWIKEARDKYLPTTLIDADSFSSLFYRAVTALSPSVNDCSLLVIGDGASEFLIVRNGLPQATFFMPFGLNSIITDISQTTGLLSHEAKCLTKENSIDHAAFRSGEKQAAVKKAVAAFEIELKNLISRSVDEQSLPKPVFLQTECDHESYFSPIVERAAEAVSGTKHAVHPITSEFFSCGDIRDASLLCLAYVFHKKLYEDHYLDL